MWESTRSSTLDQLLRDSVAKVFPVEGLREHLHDEDVVVSVYDQAGEQVGFAEDDAVGVGVADVVLAEGDGMVEALAQQRKQLGFTDGFAG